MRDPGLEAYVEAIEAHLRARRGAEQVLSPRDFSLARSWHQAGVPLAAVLVGIDQALDAGGGASLAYCRRRVEELAAAGPRPASQPEPPVEAPPLPELARLLSGLGDRLDALRAGPRPCFEPPLRKIREMQDLLAVSSRPNWEYLRRKLREIDDDVSAAVLEALTTEERAAVEAEASRAADRYRGRLDAEAIEDARGRLLVQRGRERLGLVRVALI